MITERKRGFGPGTWALIALGGAVVLMVIAWAVAGPAVSGGPAPGYGPGYGPGGGMMPWGGVMPWNWGTTWAFGAMMPLMLAGVLLFWLAVVLGIVALVRAAAGLPSGRREETTDALELARRRYAQGEISREEYERLRDDLTRAA